MAEMPIYHSPWVFPIYKYYPAINDVEPYTGGVVIFYALAAISMFWCIWATVEIQPSWLGVSITCAMEALLVFFTLYVTNTNNVIYRQISPYVDHLVIKTAWLDAKENLCKLLNIDSRAEYNSYEVWWRRRHQLRNYMMFWQKGSILAWPETMEFEV
jgi:hypothetical protein